MKSKRRMPAEIDSGEHQSGASHEQCMLIQDEIWRVVEEAERSGAPLSLGAATRRIEDAFSPSGLSTLNIADAIIYAAVDAGVAVETRISAPRQVAVERLPRFSLAALRGRMPGGAAAARSAGPVFEARP